MKALTITAPGQLEVLDAPVPSIAADEILVRSRTVGICHSDFDLLAGKYIIPVDFPIVPGHEWVGEVAETGGDVQGFASGDRVVGECVIGDDHFGFSISGAAAEYFVVKPAWLHKVPESISDAQAALVEPFTCGYYAVRHADDVDASDTAFVFGAGPIGLGAIATLHHMGARVVCVEANPARRDLGLQVGADDTLDPLAEGFADGAAELTEGRGASVVVEASGNPTAMATTLQVAGFGARLVNIGINVGGSAPAELGLIQSKQLQIRGTIGSPGVWPQALRFLARTGLDLTPIVSATVPLGDGPRGFEVAEDRANNVKVHLTNADAS
jgi:L-iditol 2-dehydrogenase